MNDKEYRKVVMTLRYPPSERNRPSIMLLRSLAMELELERDNSPGGYGGIKLERERLSKALKEKIDDPRLSDWDRDMIKGL
jgi:hypothetical protein